MNRIRKRTLYSGLIIVLTVMSLCASSLAATNLFDTVRSSLVLIRTARGSGSCFLLRTADGMYLITNEHLLRGGRPISAKLLNGTDLKLEKLEICGNHDLARFELLDSPLSALRLTQQDPNIGDAVAVFGNSDSAGVITKLHGKILGVGPDRLEIDAKFVRGNSGSPIVSDDGTVLAVATYATRFADPNDWVKAGTRFTQVRRFGMKLDNVKWKELTFDEYFLRIDALADLKTYCNDVYDLLWTKTYSTGSPYYLWKYDAVKNRSRYRHHYRLCNLLSNAADAYSQYIRWIDVRSLHAKSKPKSRQEYDKRYRSWFMADAQATQTYEPLRKARNALYNVPAKFIKRQNWLTPLFQREAMHWHDVLRVIVPQK